MTEISALDHYSAVIVLVRAEMSGFDDSRETTVPYLNCIRKEDIY